MAQVLNKFIKESKDLVTTHEAIRAGFLSIALEKNRIADPYVKQAHSFRALVNGVKKPEDLLTIKNVRSFLISASGLSDKSLAYLDENDQSKAINDLVNNFLKPAGDSFIDEVIYRFLLSKGDAVGGTMRNRIGIMGQIRLVKSILSVFAIRNIKFAWLNNETKIWGEGSATSLNGKEELIKGLRWKNQKGENRVLFFNRKNAIVGKNIDISLFEVLDFKNSGTDFNFDSNHLLGIAFGELKGGMDPAGADEHWKTGNTALERIRESYKHNGETIKTCFIAASIADSMAKEIYNQLSSGLLSNAANLMNDYQLVDICNWLLDL